MSITMKPRVVSVITNGNILMYQSLLGVLVGNVRTKGLCIGCFDSGII